METAEIIERFQRLDKKFELEAVEAALANCEAITPALLAVLEEVAEKGAAVDPTGEYMAHLYAMFLLAQFRETRAYPIVVRIAMLPSDELDELFEDFITASLDSVLASVCGGDLSGIKSIIECETADQWARGAAIDSLLALVNAGALSREEVLDYFGILYREKLARTPENDVVWSELICSTADLYPEELMSEIERAYADELVDITFVDLDDVRVDLSKGKERMLADLAASPHHQLVNDIVNEFGSWYCFHEDERDADNRTAESNADDEINAWDVITEPGQWNALAPATYRREAPKIGRNDPCPCGSGKKYKKCCGK